MTENILNDDITSKKNDNLNTMNIYHKENYIL